MRLLSVLAGVCAMVLGAAVPSVVSAQTYIDIAGWGVKNQGPAKAKGIIYFQRGYAPREPTIDEWALVPYFLLTLNQDGWDVVVTKIRYAPKPSDSTNVRPILDNAFANGIANTTRHLQDYRKHGYKSVIAAGHSFGGWVSLHALARNRELADKVIVSAPTMHGRPWLTTGAGGPNPRHRDLIPESVDLFSRLKVPVFAMFLDGDEFEPKSRASRLTPIIRKISGSYVVDRPKAFQGHFSNWTPIFDYVYGACLKGFLEASPAADCETTDLNDKDPRAILKFNPADAEKGAVPAERLLGRKFVRYGLGQRNTHLTIKDDAKLDILFGDGKRETAAYKLSASTGGATQLCIKSACSNLVRVGERTILEFDAGKGDLVNTWIEP